MGWVELGRIGAPYGVQGWLHVQSFTDPPEGLLKFRRWSVRLGGTDERIEHHVVSGQLQGRGLVVRLEGVEGRDAAARLTGGSIGVGWHELPPAGERKFYRTDLIGFEVRNAEGKVLGKVDYFVDAPAGAVMVVRGEREHWVPATPQHLRKVDLDAGSIVVDWPDESP
jgi:16S rRNA processing protein RimM